MGNFIILKLAKDKYVFKLKTVTGRTILTSNPYLSKESCLSGIQKIRTDVLDENRFKKRTENNDYYFILQDAEGKSIALGEKYTTGWKRRRGMKLVLKKIKSKNIIDLDTGTNKDFRKDLRDERSHMEGLLNQRFNFFIIIFGLIVAAIPYVKSERHLGLILIIGTIIEALFTLLIGRAQRKLEINMNLLADLGEEPSKEIDIMANSGWKWNPLNHSVVKIMGYYLTIALTILLLISTFIVHWIYLFFKIKC